MSKIFVPSSTSNPWKLTTERIVITGVLAAITIILGVIPGIGFIPIPNTTGHATIEHIPTILGGIVAGPVVGFISGLIFGLVSFLNPAAAPIFKDPLVSVLPRVFIGLTAWATFAALVRVNRDIAAAAAGFVGAATNTVLVVGMIILRGYYPAQVIIPSVLFQSIIEAIGAAVLTVLLARVFFILQSRLVRAPDDRPRDELPY